MKELLGKVEEFYKSHPISVPTRKVFEKHLRRMAWKNPDMNWLEFYWDTVEELLTIVVEDDLTSPLELDCEDFMDVACFLTEEVADEGGKAEVARNALSAMRTFYNMLIAEMHEGQYILAELKEAEEALFEDGQFLIPDDFSYDLYEMLAKDGNVTEREFDRINDLIAKLQRKMVEHFRQACYRTEVARAKILFFGPFTSVEKIDVFHEENQAGYHFWDYFLFNYHMLYNDRTPLEDYMENAKKISPEEHVVLKSLHSSKFAILYVKKIYEDYVECRDLFTEEVVELPLPDIRARDFAKYLLYGNFHPSGPLLHYVSSIPVSKSLRKRIKEEIQRQHLFFQHRLPPARMEDFFTRHNAVVRHTIQILANYAQLNILPFQEYEKPIQVDFSVREEFSAAMQRFEGIAITGGLGSYGTSTLLKLYLDFLKLSDLSDTQKRRNTTQAAVLAVFLKNNGMMPELWKKFFMGINEKRVGELIKEVEDTLRCTSFDPRYLIEDGFVRALFWEREDE